MDDAAGRRLAFGLGDGPGLRSSRDKHLAARGTDAAQWIPIGGSGSAAAGALRTEFRFVEIGLFGAGVFPVHVEFLSNKHGAMSFDALAGLAVLAHEGHAPLTSHT